VSRRSKVRGLGLLGAGLTILALTPSATHAQAQGLTLDEVVEMQHRGVSTRQMLRSAQEYCIAFMLTDSTLRVLRAAGAEQQLLDGLRQTCTTEAPLARMQPGMLLDVDFSKASALGEFTAEDGLCTARFARNGLRFENRRREGGCVIGYPSDPLEGPVRIELTMSDLGAQRPGTVVLGFGRDGDGWNHYSFSIDTYQRAELCLNLGDKCRRLVARSRVTGILIQPGAKNQLVVDVRGRNLTLAVNGQQVGTYTADSPVNGGLVIGVGAMTKVVFEQLKARTLGSERTTAEVRP
jgi:hypothetical protein